MKDARPRAMLPDNETTKKFDAVPGMAEMIKMIESLIPEKMPINEVEEIYGNFVINHSLPVMMGVLIGGKSSDGDKFQMLLIHAITRAFDNRTKNLSNS